MTKALSTGVIIGLFWATFGVAAVQAADDAPKAYVVLVGISDYPDKLIKPRAHGEDDAKALYDLFTNKDYLDTDKDNVKLLLGKKDDNRPSEVATKENIRKAVQWGVEKAGPNDLFI